MPYLTQPACFVIGRCFFRAGIYVPSIARSARTIYQASHRIKAHRSTSQLHLQRLFLTSRPFPLCHLLLLRFEMSFGVLGYWLRAVLSGETNISFYTLPLSWIICLLPRLFAVFTYATSTGKPIEFGHPRNLAQVAGSDPALTSRTRGRIIRAEAAATDTIESAPYFGAAILAGTQLGLPVGLLNALSLAYLATRVAYINAYIFSETIAVAVLRALFFTIGHMIIWWLFILAGMQT